MNMAGGLVRMESRLINQSIPKRTHWHSAALALALAVIASIALGSVAYGAADSTSTSMSCSPDPVFVSNTTTCTVTVTNTGGGSGFGTPQGSVSVTLTTGPGSISSNTCGALSSGQCTFGYTPSAFGTGTHSFSLSYTSSNAANWNNSLGSGSITVNLRTTTTVVSNCTSPLFVTQTGTCDVTVTDTAMGTVSQPQGTVALTDSTGNGSFGPCTLVPFGINATHCTVNFTPTGASVHTIKATYTPSGTSTGLHAGSNDATGQNVTVNKRTTSTTVKCLPTPVFIFQDTQCTATVVDSSPGTTSIPSGTATFSDGTKAGTFSPSDSCTLANGSCSVTYTPGSGDAGTTMITDTYGGSNVHESSMGTTSPDLTVMLRPTQTTVECLNSAGLPDGILVDEAGTCTVHVEDTAPAGIKAPPEGTPTIVKGVDGADITFGVCPSLASDGPAKSKCEVSISPTAVTKSGVDTVTLGVVATYPASNVHETSLAMGNTTISKRPTETTLGCTVSGTTITCSVTVVDRPGNRGTASMPTGTVERQPSPGITCSLSGGSCFLPDITATTLFESVFVKYLGNTKHMTSSAQRTLTISSDNFSTGGVTDVFETIKNIRIACSALNDAIFALDIVIQAITASVPDPVVVAGFLVSAGSTIPVKGIIINVLAGIKAAMQVTVLIMCADFDGDGIPAVVEADIGTSDFKFDSDTDGISDMDELTMAGGKVRKTFDPNNLSGVKLGFGCPSPTHPDSDADGLSDGEERGPAGAGTDPCNPDTDGDQVGDEVEVDSLKQLDPRTHSDPLKADTDNDGLPDFFEKRDGSCPYVNVPDSDKDGLLDGTEDANHDGITVNTIGHSATQGSGETDFCNPDTDGDGLSDGVEVGLFGNSVTAMTPTGPVTTMPALDDDMDNEGLSDYEEHVTTQTDPLNSDTDGDTITDANELIATAGSFPKRTFTQVSNPLSKDTDNDGLPDNIEYGGSGLGISRGLGGTPDTVCPFVANPDSDNDALLDGTEDTNHDGTTVNTIGHTGTQGSGETNPCNADTDGDGLSDGVEVGLFGNSVTATTPSGSVTTVPALDDDMDNEGLSDYEEHVTTQTDPLNADTDGDTITDANELIATAGSFPQRTFTQVSNPLSKDTDNDGLPDNIEYSGSGLGISRGLGGSVDTVCPFVANPDSDNDALLDGTEDANHDGTTVNTIGHTGTQGSGETNPCNPDTDGDGLSDGVEVGLFGSSVTAMTPSGPVTTVPALDDDTDDDGLSEYEEHVTTQTDPLNADTDGDTLTDGNELIASAGSFPKRTFMQVSNPLSKDTDNDGLPDNIEYSGSGLGTSRGLGGTPDTVCPFVANPDSDNDALLDGTEDTNHDGTTVNTIGHSATQGSGETDPCNADTDGDGLSDGVEVGLFGTSVTAMTPSGPVTTVPALDDDMDNEGLSDYEEHVTTQTDPLNADTDGDTITDANELIATGTFPKRAFTQVSDPLIKDTDGDGLSDNIEYSGSGLGTSRSAGGVDDTVCPFVNDADSDNDGLKDGTEDANHNGIITNTIGHSATQGSGETDFCNPDTDGDGLSDGVEVGLFGTSVTATTPSGSVTTVPALDDDMDNEGLSDYEEHVTTQTDPLNADTDGDHITDANELIATGGTFPKRIFHQESDPLTRNTDGDGFTDDVEWVNSAVGLASIDVIKGSGLGDPGNPAFRNTGGVPDTVCPFVNNNDSDNDAIHDGVSVTITVRTAPSKFNPSGMVVVTHTEGFAPITSGSGTVGVPGSNDGHLNSLSPGTGGTGGAGTLANTCNPDSDGDGLTDGQEIAIVTNPDDWDTDNDGLPDNEVNGVLGQVPPTDPLDPDTDDDGLFDGTEVVGTVNTPVAPANFRITDPTKPDTDRDGLCDGGEKARIANGLTTLSPVCTAGIFNHPNNGTTPGLAFGIGEDENGNGAMDALETDPTLPDTDHDGEGDGVERLGFSTPRPIPAFDSLGRPTRVVYPKPGCMDPLNPDTDGDGLLDGVEDVNHDGNFDFRPTDFDLKTGGGLTIGLAIPPNPPETNPCDADTDHDSNPGSVNSFGSNGGNSSDAEERARDTNPLDFDSDNDLIDDGVEVAFLCVTPVNPDPAHLTIISVPNLNPLSRDSDGDGIIDGLEDLNLNDRYEPTIGETDPCASALIPIIGSVSSPPPTALIDSDGDGISDADEVAAGTDPHDPKDHPSVMNKVDLNLDGQANDQLWLEDPNHDHIADSVAIDINSDGLVDARIQVIPARDLTKGDFDNDGKADDCRYVITYAFANQRSLHPRIVLTIDDFKCDGTIDKVDVVSK